MRPLPTTTNFTSSTQTTDRKTKQNSTLDRVLRREVNGPDWGSLAAIAAAAAAYLFAPPGVLPGAYDYYVRTPLYRRYGGAGSPRALDREDLVLGRRLGAGGFGDVYRATLAEGVPGLSSSGRGRRRAAGDGDGGGGGDGDDADELAEQQGGDDRAVVVKRAKEFGEAEAWMNERLARAAPGSVAEFVAAFEERPAPDEAERRREKRRQRRRAEGGEAAGAGGLFGLLGGGGADAKKDAKKKKRRAVGGGGGAQAAAAANAAPGAVWLVWRDEGDSTLADLMGAREWPYSAEQAFLGRELRLPRGARRRAVTVRLAMRQLLGCIAACHRAGIVHRDIKPQNAILATRGGGRAAAAGAGNGSDGGEGEGAGEGAAVGRLKLIDLGAAADLRIGINYAPSEYLMDPRYAPPQQYIMQRQTPSPPPLKPVAALLSPVLWLVGRPDRFDAYSAGVTLMQMAFPPLRTDAGLFQFRKNLEEAGWDLHEWRRRVEAGEGGGDGAGSGGRNGGGGGGGARALFGALFGASSPAAGAAATGYAAGFEMLDLDGGAGWELARGLLALQPGDRLSAAAALRHSWFARAPDELSADGASSASSSSPSSLGGRASVAVAAAQRLLERADAGTGATAAAAAAARSVGDQLGRAAEAAGGAALLESAITHGAGRDGALTEAQLADEFGYADVMSLAALEAAEAKKGRERAQRQKQRDRRRDARDKVAQRRGTGQEQGQGQEKQGGLFGGLFGGRPAAAADRYAEEDEEEEDEEEERRQQQRRPRALPPVFGASAGPPRNARRTIAWWQERQSDLQRELSARRRGVSATIRGAFDASGAAKEREAVRRQQKKKPAAAQAQAPSAVVAVPPRPAAFGGGSPVEEGQERGAQVAASRRAVAPERPGSPAAIAWLTSLLNEIGAELGGEEEEEEERGGVAAAAAAAAATAQEAAAAPAAERKR